MILVWTFLIIEILLYYIIKPFIDNPEFYATVLILLNLPLVFISLARHEKNIILLLFIGLFLRLILMYWDIFAQDIFTLPHSGNDSSGFYISALKISENLSLIKEPIYGGLYSKILGVFLFLGPTSRILLQYFNVLLGMTTIMIVYKMLIKLNISFKINKYLLIIMIFLPSSLIFSSILLREALIVFLVVLSITFFIDWILQGTIKHVFISFILILLGGIFHSGVLSIILGYVFMLLFFKPNIKQFRLSIQSFFSFFIFVIFFVIINIISVENLPFLDKFVHQYEANEDIYNLASGGRGGSVYLQNLEITNPVELILFAPIKMLYFILSPIPFNWRGITDVFSFLFDSIVYAILFFYPLINYRKMIKGDPVTIFLFIIIISSVFVFGISLNNSGTAIRHRYKFFYLIIIFFGLAIRNRKTNSS